MNLRYNAGRFEVEFSADFQGDLSAVKAAGFKTDGPPSWVWWTTKVPVLQKLRENRPASGLTITPEGLEIYKQLEEAFSKNAAVKAEAAKVIKAQKKAREEERHYTPVVIPEGKIWIGPEDLPPTPPFVSSTIIPPSPSLRCITCKDPVYKEFELAEPPICLWCEKTLFDTHKKT